MIKKTLFQFQEIMSLRNINAWIPFFADLLKYIRVVLKAWISNLQIKR